MGNDRTNWLLDEVNATREARERAGDGEQPGYDHAQKSKLEDLAFGHWSHKKLAGQVRMLMRSDLDHEAIVMAARDRIAWLAKRVEDLESELAKAEGK